MQVGQPLHVPLALPGLDAPEMVYKVLHHERLVLPRLLHLHTR